MKMTSVFRFGLTAFMMLMAVSTCQTLLAQDGDPNTPDAPQQVQQDEKKEGNPQPKRDDAKQDPAEDPQTTAGQWNDAKEQFSADIKKAEEYVTVQLGLLERSARARGDIESLEVVADQRRKFEADGTFPNQVPRAEYDHLLQKAEENFHNSYKNLLAELLSAYRDTQAERLVKEYEAIAGKDSKKTEEPDGFTLEWNQAKEKFFQQLAEARKTLLAQLETVENDARASGDLKRVKATVAQRLAFMENGTIPEYCSRETYDEKRSAAAAALQIAHRKIVIQLLTNRLDDDAEKITAEKSSLIAGIPSVTETVPEKMPTGNRTLWQCTSYDAKFIRVGNKRWIEVAGKSKKPRFRFEERRRTADAIELYDDKRGMLIRLLPKKMQIHNGQWENAAGGHWVDTTDDNAAPRK